MAVSEVIKKRGNTQSTVGQQKIGDDEPHSLTFPVLAGSQQFRHLVSALGGVAYVSSKFKMTPELVHSYLTGAIDPPYTVLLALYWHSHYGFSQAFSEAHWTHNYNSFKRREAEEKVVHLERVVEHAVALLERRKGALEALRDFANSPA
jgi:hypothetical protein